MPRECFYKQVLGKSLWVFFFYNKRIVSDSSVMTCLKEERTRLLWYTKHVQSHIHIQTNTHTHITKHTRAHTNTGIYTYMHNDNHKHFQHTKIHEGSRLSFSCHLFANVQQLYWMHIVVCMYKIRFQIQT